MATPLINGEAYAWAQIVCTVLNVPIVGITEIKYNAKQVKKDNYSTGVYPTSRGYGNKEFDASITFAMEELEAIRRAVPGGDILDVPPFQVVVNFIPKNGIVVTHTLFNAEFLEDPRDAKQGDTMISCTIPLIISHIVKSDG